MSSEARTLYIFLDESGNLDFSPNGTKYFVLTGLLAFDIMPAVVEMHRLKHEVIRAGTDLEFFHATEDRQVVRDQVFAIIADCRNIVAHAVLVEKSRVPLLTREEIRLYRLLCQPLFVSMFAWLNLSDIERVIIFYDQIGARRKQHAVLNGIKSSVKAVMGDKHFDVLMHDSKSHPYLQIVDYLCWAFYVRRNRGEERPFKAIQHLVRGEREVLSDGEQRN